MAAWLVELAQAAGRDGLLCLMPDEQQAELAARIAPQLAPDLEAWVFPGWDCLPFDPVPPSREVMGRRMAVLRALAHAPRERWLVLASPEAAAQCVPPRSLWRDFDLALRLGERLDAEALLPRLARAGYLLDDRVDEPGEAALRGQVLDIFPAGEDLPWRVTHDDGRIAEIRRYDPVSQRTVDEHAQVLELLPASEVVLPPDADPAERAPAIEHRLAGFYQRAETLFDYAPQAALAAAPCFEPALARFQQQVEEARQDATELAGAGLHLDRNGWAAAIRGRALHRLKADTIRPGPDFARERRPGEALRRHLRERLAVGDRGLLTAPDDRSLARLTRQVEAAQPIRPAASWMAVRRARRGALLAMRSAMPSGFLRSGVTVVAANDLFAEGATEESAADVALALPALRLGDTVIHADHGIGILKGVETVEAGRETRDMLRLEFAGDAVLMLPALEIGRLRRYGADPAAVTLDRLDGTAWPRRRATLEAEIAESARRMLALAAARQRARAVVLEPPAEPMDRFAARFPYRETPGQRAAIRAALADLACGRPMDRLVCGDVGFGKTEVALRAAAAAVFAGKQVALAAPTTTLVRQHLQTFRRRFAGFGIEVAQLSRLAGASEARDVKQGLADGRIQLVVGTHALAGPDVRFRDLALVVIDEEQRFGAAEKATLRQLARGAHVLTLTATPIPRTLMSALAGVRDVSVIATPPVRRRPVRTLLLPFDEAQVRRALLRERGRGGQSFVVCPRIADIGTMAERLARIVPELTIVAVHGRMAAERIDDAMLRFADGKADLLLATNIIENGLDLPRANTMLVWRPDRFGLAQLHQLRGRVGRGSRRGFAYLLRDPAGRLGPSTEARLRTLEVLDRLGAGFEISTRDLDLRGAGDFLGEEQAGHLSLIGAELYRDLFERALRRLRGDPAPPDWQPELGIAASAYVPAEYLPEPELRIDSYRRLAAIDAPEAVERLAEEIEDRFGPPPPPVIALLERQRLLALCRQGRIQRLDSGPKATALAFRSLTDTQRRLLVRALGGSWRGGRLICRPAENAAALAALLERAVDLLGAGRTAADVPLDRPAKLAHAAPGRTQHGRRRRTG